MKKSIIKFSFFICLQIFLFQFGVKAQVDNKIKNLQNQYKQYAQANRDNFEDYKVNQNAKFAEFLKQEWEKYSLYKGIVANSVLKPEVIPSFDKEKDKLENFKINLLQHIEKNNKSILSPPRLFEAKPDIINKKKIDFLFYGTPVSLTYDSNIANENITIINEKVIARFWEDQCNNNYNRLIAQFIKYKDKMNLNDWGYFKLIENAVNNISHSETNTKFLTWFLLSQSGYKVKIGFNDNETSILLASISEMYNTQFLTFNGLNYYVIGATLEDNNINTYDFDFPGANRIMDLNISKPLFFSSKILNKEIVFSYNDKKYNFQFKYNKNIIDFYKDYPLCELRVPFNASVSTITKESLVSNFLPLISGKSEFDAVSMILNFVQNAFAYKTDEENFGKEKFYFPEEVIYYPFSDCEDRSVLFSFLVRELLNLDVVGLNFPGHVATAVNFNENIDGTFFILNNEKFVVCDPTYINAPVGTIMPEFRSTKAGFIRSNKAIKNIIAKNKIRNILLKSGAFMGVGENNIVFDKLGNSYCVGYFNGIINIDTIQMKSMDELNDIFIGKFDNKSKLLWIKQMKGMGNEIAYSISNNINDGVYIMGSYDSTIRLNKLELQSEGSLNFFISKLDFEGNVNWLKEAELSAKQANVFTDFLSYFDFEGNHKWTRYGETTEYSRDYGITFDSSGVYMKASLSSSITLFSNNKTYQNYANFIGINDIISEYEKLIINNYDKSIAGMFAIINLIKGQNAIITGQTAKAAIDKVNPEFKEKNKDFYNNMEKISSMKNNNGIIVIETLNNEPVVFSNLKIINRTKASFEFYKNGNIRIITTSGVKIGKYGLYPYKLNYIQMFKNNATLLFDYDDDHSLSLVPVRPDIIE